MVCSWNRAKLSELIHLKHGYAFLGQYFTDNSDRVVLLTPGNFRIGGGFKEDKPRGYSGPIPQEYVLNAGDLILTMTDLSRAADTLGYPAFIPAQEGRTFLHNQRLGKVELLPGVELDLRFLYYLLCSAPYRHEIVAGATGSTVKHTSPTRIMNFVFYKPCLKEQTRIGNTLYALDARIALLQKQAFELESIARAIFKSWFVDFDPVRAKAEGKEPEGMDAATAALFPEKFVLGSGGPIPYGWTHNDFSALATVIYGAAFASKSFNNVSVGMPLIRIRDLKTMRPGVFTEELHPKGYLVSPGDVVVGMDGEFRAYHWLGEPAWLNQRVCLFKPNFPASRTFILQALRPLLAEVERGQVGTTVIHIGKADIDRFRTIIPSEPVIIAFNAVCEPLLDRLVFNAEAERSLIELRDNLLPRLISGRLRVPEAEKLVGAVL